MHKEVRRRKKKTGIFFSEDKVDTKDSSSKTKNSIMHSVY